MMGFWDRAARAVGTGRGRLQRGLPHLPGWGKGLGHALHVVAEDGRVRPSVYPLTSEQHQLFHEEKGRVRIKHLQMDVPWAPPSGLHESKWLPMPASEFSRANELPSHAENCL